jgi:translation initiation factor IF-3
MKLERAKKFMEQSGRVKVHLQLSGRQMLFASQAFDKMNQFKSDLGAEYETAPQKMGRRVIATLKKVKNEQES